MSDETKDAPRGAAPQEQTQKDPFARFLENENAGKQHEALKRRIVESWRGLPELKKKNLLQALQQISGPSLHLTVNIAGEKMLQQARIPSPNGQNPDEAFAAFITDCHPMKGSPATESTRESIPGTDMPPLVFMESLLALAATDKSTQPNSAASP